MCARGRAGGGRAGRRVGGWAGGRVNQVHRTVFLPCQAKLEDVTIKQHYVM